MEDKVVDATGKIMPVEKCDNVRNLYSSPEGFRSRIQQRSPYFKPDSAYLADCALKALSEARGKDIAIHAANAVAIENNKAIHAKVAALMLEIGMPTSWHEPDLSSRSKYRRFKTKTVTPGWQGDLWRNVPTTDGFEDTTYERLKRDYELYAEKAAAEKVQADQARERADTDQKAARLANIELATIILRYGLDLHSDWPEVLDSLREKNQRLDLAVAMMDTRGDWNDGPYKVSNALRRFVAVTDEDKSIQLSIGGHCDDWCGDGRIFRDCAWNYDRLAQSVHDEQLVKDVLLARERLGDQ